MLACDGDGIITGIEHSYVCLELLLGTDDVRRFIIYTSRKNYYYEFSDVGCWWVRDGHRDIVWDHDSSQYNEIVDLYNNIAKS